MITSEDIKILSDAIQSAGFWIMTGLVINAFLRK